MIIQKDNCQICMEAISNPICKNCHTQEVDSWLKDLKIGYPERKKVISALKDKIPPNPIETNSTCIICKQNEINVCSYCFFYITLKILSDEDFSYEIIEDFLETFNYQLGYEKYEKERKIRFI